MFTYIRQCACDDDVIKYKRIIRRWINTVKDSEILRHAAYRTEHLGSAFKFSKADATIKRTLFSAQKYQDSVQDYRQLLMAWTSWAVWNDIPLDGLHNLPKGCRYSMMARIEHDISIELEGETATIPRPETDFDTRETVLWLNDLLHRRHREVC
jgi:hypothetical protein